MQSTISKVQKYIQENMLLSSPSKVIVGVSGGADSVALLDILHDLGYECIVAHCNFHLRGQESFRDEYFVEKIAHEYGLEYVSANFDTKRYIIEESISLEMAARELRYAWFEKIRKKYKAERIAVAHHQDDSVETVLINLIRGTGIRGLTGIPPINGKVIRPLLSIYREDILQYLSAKGLSFVEDSTNKKDLYVRNKIRLNVIPLLKEINPSAVQSIGKTSENLFQTEKIYTEHLETVKRKIFVNNKIDIKSLLKQKEPKTILFELLYPYGFNSSVVENIFDSAMSQPGKVFYSADYLVIKDRDCFVLEQKEEKTDVAYTLFDNEAMLEEPIPLQIEEIQYREDIQFERDANILYVDKDKLSFPLVIRKWKQGDKFIPFGMKGRKKVSDYFTDRKFNLIEKNAVWLLCSVEDIVWIIGERADDRFKVSSKTRSVLKITKLT